jgi:hypothetical protein
MKKYSEFISSNVNEGFIKDLLGGIKSFIKGDKNSIMDKIERMKEAEKDFINKSDELSYDIFYADTRRNSNEITVAARQKSLMSKRALEALRTSKNGEINLIAKEVSRICKDNPNLIDFYNQQKSIADTEIAQYAYEKAKQFKDSEYENEFYNQWKTVETSAKKMRYESPSLDLDDDTIEENNGMWDLSLREFTDQITGLPKSDILGLVDDGSSLRWKLANDLRVKENGLKEFRTRSYKSGDMASYNFVKEKAAELKNKYKMAIQSVDNKISVLKGRLRNI